MKIYSTGDTVRVFRQSDDIHEGIIIRRCDMVSGGIFYFIKIQRTLSGNRIMPPQIKIITVNHNDDNIQKIERRY